MWQNATLAGSLQKGLDTMGNDEKIKTKRIGPRMAECVEFVKAHPGCVMIEAVRHVMPRGSTMFGYRSVWRAVDAGLIVAKPGARKGTYRLSIPEE